MLHSNIFPTLPQDEFSDVESLPLLIVDNDPTIRRVLATVFTAGGYAVTCAEDGLEALELAQRQRFPLVIFALAMPRVDGIELANTLLDLDPTITCLMLAEKVQVARVIEATEIGNIYNHFWKPLQDVGDLVRAAARALEHRELRLSRAYLLSETRDVQLELRALRSRLEQLDKVSALGQLTETVAHDLESPLMGLLAYAQYLRARFDRRDTEPLSPEQIERALEYMQEMEHGVQRCYNTVQCVLDYTRVHTEPPGPVALHEVIEETLGLLLHGLDAQNIQVRLELMEEAPPVLANPRRLQQVLVNLIVNAQQALGGTGGTLTVKTEKDISESSGRESGVRVCVADTGPGIAPDILPQIFNPFFTTRSTTECLGLGLTIARNIVNEWEGDLRITSEPGNGTTALLSLPLCAEMAVPIRTVTPVSDVLETTRRAA